MLTVLLFAMLCQTPKPIALDTAIHIWPATKAPAPTPVSPDAATVIEAGKTIVIGSNVEQFYRTFPDDVLAIKRVSGPKSIFYTDDKGEIQEQEFTFKYLLVISAAPTLKSTATCKIELVPKGIQFDKDIAVKLIQANVGPKPPPPDPPVPPQPPTPVNPSPFADAGFRCLIVYETKDLSKMPTAQEQIIFSKEIRDYLNARCVAGQDGKTKEWRIYDQNIDTSQDSKVWQDTMKRERKSVPWVYIGDGKAGFEGPLPSDVNSMLALLKKFGGA